MSRPKCQCENPEVIGCVRIKIKGTLLHRREYDQTLDSLCPIEPGDIAILPEITMCADGKQSYREQGYKPRNGEQLWDESAMNPKNKKEKKQSTGTEFLEDCVR